MFVALTNTTKQLTLNNSTLLRNEFGEVYDTPTLKMFVILHCCWRQTDALLVVVFYAI